MQSAGTRMFQPARNEDRLILRFYRELIGAMSLRSAALAAFAIAAVMYVAAPAIISYRDNVVSAFEETICTFESSNCTTPKNSWNLGETACAVAAGTVGDRSIEWVAPNGAVARVGTSFS